MSERSGARILLEVLKAEGVDVVFGIPGGSVIPILDAFHSEKDVRFILMRHEQGAGIAVGGVGSTLLMAHQNMAKLGVSG